MGPATLLSNGTYFKHAQHELNSNNISKNIEMGKLFLTHFPHTGLDFFDFVHNKAYDKNKYKYSVRSSSIYNMKGLNLYCVHPV